mmetsp:Transcript_149548/g.363237  ORF Transcript_149548/g.363237 Transcript_149548/m.363237 type:complete len:104 (-) Transcript_149548:1-312(-)
MSWHLCAGSTFRATFEHARPSVLFSRTSAMLIGSSGHCFNFEDHLAEAQKRPPVEHVYRELAVWAAHGAQPAPCWIMNLPANLLVGLSESGALGAKDPNMYLE